MTFKDQVALVTGAQRGIGKAVAGAFAHEDAHVILNDVCDQEDLVKTAKDLSTYEGQCVAMRADVSQADQVQAMVSQIENQFQRLDILVNNAGIIRRGSIETVSEEEWDQVITRNLKGVYLCSKAAIPTFKSQKKGCQNYFWHPLIF